MYIKAEDPVYLTGGKAFELDADGYDPIKIHIRITESED